jgi:hypothetical protein
MIDRSTGQLHECATTYFRVDAQHTHISPKTQPAVYFVDASEENIQRIAEDCSKRLYSQVYLNFVSRLDRPLMERLARATIASNTYSLVTKVFDQYLDFVTLEPRLFTLNQPVRRVTRIFVSCVSTRHLTTAVAPHGPNQTTS